MRFPNTHICHLTVQLYHYFYPQCKITVQNSTDFYENQDAWSPNYLYPIAEPDFSSSQGSVCYCYTIAGL